MIADEICRLKSVKLNGGIADQLKFNGAVYGPGPPSRSSRT
jgi:hypothetical protein